MFVCLNSRKYQDCQNASWSGSWMQHETKHATVQIDRHQDNLYLSKYARAFGVMGAKASKTDELAWLLNKSEPCLNLPEQTHLGPGAFL